MEILMWTCVGAGVAIGSAACFFAMGMIGFVGEVYASWQHGRDLALLVTETNHKRRVELLAKVIELQRAMQPVPFEEPVIQSADPLVNGMAGSCSDSSEKCCDPLTHAI